jgi:hypothetical protein
VTVGLFTFIDLYSRVLGTASHLVKKGAEHAAGLGVTEGEMLDEWRLADDMQPLRFQLQVVGNFAQQWPARAAGIETPPDLPGDLDVAGFQQAFDEARAYLAGLTPAQFDGRDEAPVTFTIGTGMTPTLPAGQWLTVFATTNLYFHLSTAYGILRSKGTPIGKVDLFATGL